MYKALLEITTTSDWTQVYFRSNNLAAARVYIAKGADAPQLRTYTSLSENSILITKMKYDKTKVVANAMVIVANVTEERSVLIEIQKGSIGSTTLVLYNENQGNHRSVLIATNTRSGGEWNPILISLDADKLIQGGPILLSGTARFGRFTWAFYYPWYYLRSWSRTIPTRTIDTPLIGAYDSSDPSVIEAHIRMAKSAGIDGFIVSWWGADGGVYGSVTDLNLEVILTVASRYSFNIAIYFESYAFGHPTPPFRLEQMFREFFDRYGNDTRYFRIGNLPVIFLYSVDSQPVSVWSDLIQKMSQDGHSAFYVADTDDQSYFQIFEGIHRYVPPLKTNLGSYYVRLSLSARTYPLLYPESNKTLLWAATIIPGADARQTTWAPDFYFPREEAGLYKSTFEAASGSDPDWLLITSFNEWWENTHIEPGRTYGWEYLDLTTKFTSAFKHVRYVPHVTITQMLSSPTVAVNDSVKLHVELSNFGNGSALDIQFREILASASVSVVNGTTEGKVNRLLPGETYAYDCWIRVGTIGNVTLARSSIQYSDLQDNQYFSTSEVVAVAASMRGVVSPYSAEVVVGITFLGILIVGLMLAIIRRRRKT